VAIAHSRRLFVPQARGTEDVTVHRERQPVRLAFEQAHPRKELAPARVVERAHRAPRGLLVEIDATERVGTFQIGWPRRICGQRNLGKSHLLMGQVGVVRGTEHAVHAQGGAVDAVHAQIGGNLRSAATVAQDLDVDGHGAGWHGREKDGVRRDELEVGPIECLVHRAQRRVHRNAAEDVDDLPRIRKIGVEPVRSPGVRCQRRVRTQVVRHRNSLRCCPWNIACLD
jgi:hypothetical protein